MNIEKSRLISEAAPHLNASLGTINGNEFAAIVPVIPGHIGGRETNIVSAKALHKALGVGKDFSTWITDRISEYDFTIGHDYSVHQNNFPKFGEKPEWRGLQQDKALWQTRQRLSVKCRNGERTGNDRTQ